MAAAARSSTVPFEQIGQSAVKRLWRQKTDKPSEHMRRAPVSGSAPVLTAIVSDLHLGTASGAGPRAAPHVRERMFAALADADRVVVLGDLLELRESPGRSVLEAAEPFLRELGEACAGKPLVIVPGNHDHELIVTGAGSRAAELGRAAGDDGIVRPGHRRAAPSRRRADRRAT